MGVNNYVESIIQILNIYSEAPWRTTVLWLNGVDFYLVGCLFFDVRMWRCERVTGVLLTPILSAEYWSRIYNISNLTLFSVKVLFKIIWAIKRLYIKKFKLTYQIFFWTQSYAEHTHLFLPRRKHAQLWSCIFKGKKFQYQTDFLKTRVEPYRLSIFLKKLNCNFKIIRIFVSSIATEVFNSQVTIKFEQVFLR